MSGTPRQIVLTFLEVVRSGKDPWSAGKYMAPEVIANQVISEDSQVIIRTPDQYAEHVLEMKAEYGDFEFVIDELLADGDKVFARWTQTGNGIRECASCVYRIQSGHIVEYWIQIDRLGIQIQKDRL
jgi:predicted ester cyclase